MIFVTSLRNSDQKRTTIVLNLCTVTPCTGKTLKTMYYLNLNGGTVGVTVKTMARIRNIALTSHPDLGK